MAGDDWISADSSITISRGDVGLPVRLGDLESSSRVGGLGELGATDTEGS